MSYFIAIEAWPLGFPIPQFTFGIVLFKKAHVFQEIPFGFTCPFELCGPFSF
jgi:hypothetical protein